MGDDWEEDEATVAVDFHEESGVQRERGRTYLVVLTGNRIGEVVKVEHGMTVGRGAAASFRIADMGASRIHIKLEVDENKRVTVTDQDSRNGIYINGQRVFSAKLEDGDKIRIGTTTILKFSYTDRLEESFQQQMYDSAIRDPLTRLYNRRHLQTQLEAELSYSNRHNAPFSLIMLDLDHFKQVNDTFGHQVGDEVLVNFALLVKRSLRAEDLAARFGGEEFAVLCRGLRIDDARRVAVRLRHLVQESSLVATKPELRVTVSGGVAMAPTATVRDPHTLIEAADRALYAAKHEGRNRICVAKDPDDEE